MKISPIKTTMKVNEPSLLQYKILIFSIPFFNIYI